MKDFLMILPTHSSYLGVVNNFLELLKKNWPECPFEIIVSIAGKDSELKGTKCIYNGKEATLIDCLVNVAKKTKRKYYISFLGDAFINSKIDSSLINDILREIEDSNAAYCSLQCVKNYKRKKACGKFLRYINNLDRYSHNFTAFVASRDFLLNEMSKFESDLEFEKRYLYQKDNYYFDNHLIVCRNYFNLLPSITKGKWDRINYKELRRDNPDIEFENRPLQSWKESFLFHIRGNVVHVLPSSVRIITKRLSEWLFRVKFGVDN